MVVMMHSTLGVEAAAGRRPAACMRSVTFAQPFRMPDFFLISGLFLARRDRPRLAHLSRPQGRALRLFLRAVDDDPVRLQGAGLRRRDAAGAMSACSISNPSSSRSARSGSSICCRSSSSSPSCHAALPPLAIWLVAAALEIAHIETGWTVIDEFARASSISTPAICSRSYIFALSARARDKPALALIGLALWALVNGGAGVRRACRLAAGLAGARLRRRRRGRRHRHAAGADAVAQLPALLRRALDRHLSRLLPADGGDPDAAAQDRHDHRYRHDLADRHGRRRRRRAGDLAAGAALRADFLFERPAAFWIAPKKAAPALQPAE